MNHYEPFSLQIVPRLDGVGVAVVYPACIRARAAYLRKSVSADDHLDMGSDYSPGTAVEGKPIRSNKGKLKRKFVTGDLITSLSFVIGSPVSQVQQDTSIGGRGTACQSLFYLPSLHKSSSVGTLVCGCKENTFRVLSSLLVTRMLVPHESYSDKNKLQLSPPAFANSTCAAVLWHGGVLLWRMTVTQQSNNALISEHGCSSTYDLWVDCTFSPAEKRTEIRTNLLGHPGCAQSFRDHRPPNCASISVTTGSGPSALPSSILPPLPSLALPSPTSISVAPFFLSADLPLIGLLQLHLRDPTSCQTDPCLLRLTLSGPESGPEPGF
ncbi:hypothetical protein D9C73_024047 [Collichthys lucidus]|uniref:Uncharacterized protein n=1 Tax=Collichthys lucidus TaxID=240159 RepID=A0A4U5VN68_COLLU|nr:hypothetical protein D9C73_024047 [Collichthys lucidus]